MQPRFGCCERSLRASESVRIDREDIPHLETSLAKRLERGDRRSSRRYKILNKYDAAPRIDRTFDAAGCTVAFRFTPHVNHRKAEPIGEPRCMRNPRCGSACDDLGVKAGGANDLDKAVGDTAPDLRMTNCQAVVAVHGRTQS